MCVLCFATTRPMRSVHPCLKWSTFAFSACCLIVGVLVMATSLTLSFKPAYSYVFFFDNQYYSYILAAGAVLTLAGILGCVGALSRNTCLLYTFALCVGLFVVGEIVSGFLLYNYQHTFLQKLENDIRQIVEYDYGNNPPINNRMDYIQEGWKCCGSQAYTSWSTSRYGKLAQQKNDANSYYVPESCCVNKRSQECKDIRTGASVHNVTAHLHTQGCALTLVSFFETNVGPFFIGLTVVVTLQTIAAVLALVMACKLGKMIRRERYMQRESYETHQASAPMLSSAPSMDSHKMFAVSTPSSAHASKSSLHLDPAALDIPKSSLV